jgi:alpha-mannosidase
MNASRWIAVFGIMTAFAARPAHAQNPSHTFHDDFSGGLTRWRPYFDAGQWTAASGVLRSTSKEENSARLAKLPAIADVIIEAKVRVSAAGHKNFGVVLRAQDGLTCMVVRYHDQTDVLELLGYDKGRVSRLGGAADRLGLKAGEWYGFRAAALGGKIFARLWPASAEEPPAWQLEKSAVVSSPGGVGLIAEDASDVEFRDVRISWGPAIDEFQKMGARREAARQKHVAEALVLTLEPTPFVERTAGGAARRVALRTMVDNKAEPAAGTGTVSFGDTKRALSIRKGDFVDGAYPLLIPEPTEPSELRVTLDAAVGRRLEASCIVKPARRWTFYVTPHVHYDIGYTDRQPIVIERLSRDMDTVMKYIEETADWPPESRFRWTVEVSRLMKNYIERHTEAEAARFMDFVRKGSIEICGFYLNMPTEVVGHEELIRCLYYARELRNKYGIRIDTAMIHDVPGYTWALPGLLREAGLPRISLCANTIRGKFTWDRPGAVPRPFYWQGPDDRRVFVWYTPNYGDAHFLRSPGLHEREVVGIIRANEARGYRFDAIQLGTANDNAPPELNVSRNARAWNEKFVWPRMIVATNRDFLEPIEAAGGSRCETYKGDIPSWWADGPASSALENGMIRRLHDQLTATEALWTTAWLADPKLEYPRKEINAAYDKMIHFDEHTWGARGAASHPTNDETLSQWKWKAAYAYDAKKLGDELHHRILARLSERIACPAGHGVAVWNTLAWPRTDVVALPLTGTEFEGRPAIAVTDTRTKQAVPVQLSQGGKQAFFVARDVPSMGYAVFAVERAAAATPQASPGREGTLENAFYRIVAVPASGGLTSWYDKQLKRELLDPKAEYRGNQPIYERSLDGRDAITRKTPSRFGRTVPRNGKLISQTAGPVFQEMVIESSLPSLPSIRQRVRLYNDLKQVDIANVVTKEEVFEPEGVYFAFPFDVASPEIRFQIADASMRPGKDQLTYSCQDYYSIQHWADVADRDHGIILAPIDTPLVLASGLTAYKWADQIDFNNGHIFSWAMNNYWYTNFRPGQSGTMPFRYRLTSYPGKRDPAAITRFAWQPFHPLEPTWLHKTKPEAPAPPTSLFTLDSDSVVVSCVKLAETDDAIIVRLLEMSGKPSKCTLRWTLPEGCRINRAYMSNAIEEPGEPLVVPGDSAMISIPPNQVATVGLVPERRR